MDPGFSRGGGGGGGGGGGVTVMRQEENMAGEALAIAIACTSYVPFTGKYQFT